jgi:hypothetical protein
MSLIAFISALTGSTTGEVPGGGGGGTGPYTATTVEGVVYQNGGESFGYNGFPYPLNNVSDGSLITSWKKSSEHALAGEVAVARSIDGGATWTKGAVKVDGTAITADTLTMYKMRTSNYIILAWQTFAATPNITYFARILEADFIANVAHPNFTSCGSVTYAHANHKGYHFDNPIELPSGKMRLAYYTLPDSGYTGSKAGWVDSTDNGATWALGNDIVVKTGGSFPNGMISESCPVITFMGATDATTKVVVLCRNEEYGYWTHCASANGGNSFAVDTTWNFGYELGTISSTPVSSILHGGNVYVVCGTRETSGGTDSFKLKWLIIPPDDLWENVHPLGVTAVVHSYTPNASTYNLDVIHWGYPIVFHDWAGKLWCHVYDSNDGGFVLNKEKIHQLKIAD